jgi:hypothetical protein
METQHTAILSYDPESNAHREMSAKIRTLIATEERPRIAQTAAWNLRAMLEDGWQVLRTDQGWIATPQRA